MESVGNLTDRDKFTCEIEDSDACADNSELLFVDQFINKSQINQSTSSSENNLQYINTESSKLNRTEPIKESLNPNNQQTKIKIPKINTSDLSKINNDSAKQEIKQTQSGRSIFYTFDEHMWDHLPEIQNHSELGSKLLKEFTEFGKNYNNALKKFAQEIQKSKEQFLKNIEQQKKGGLKSIVDHNYFGYSNKKKQREKNETDKMLEDFEFVNLNYGDSSICEAVECMKKATNHMVVIIEEKIQLITGDLLEPLEMYIGHHDQTLQQQFTQARQIFHDYYEKQAKYTECKKIYMNLSQDSEQFEIDIEKALLSQQQGEISVDKVQEIMNQSLDTKYKIQVALKGYKESINELNQAQFELTNEYRPILQQIQQYEESRINFTKYNFDKFLKHLQSLGKKFQDEGVNLQKELQLTKSEYELNQFIQQHLTDKSFPSEEIKFEEFEMSDDLKRYKKFLAEQTQELKIQSDNKIQEIMDLEKTKQQLYEVIQNIIYHKKITDKSEQEIVPSKEELSKLILAFHEKDMRMRITEILKQVCTQKCVVSYRGLQTLGELIKYLLTAIIHEKDVNFKVIYAILNSSQQLYYQNPNSLDDQQSDYLIEQKQRIDSSATLNRRQMIRCKRTYKKKYYLTEFINDHGIWQEENIWKSVLQKVLNQKFQEAVQKDKDRKNLNNDEANEENQEEYKNQLVKQFMGNMNYFGKTFKGTLWGSGNQNELKNDKNDGKGNKNDDKNKNKTQTMRIPKTLAQNIIFNTISNFMFHFINFRYSLSNSKEVVLYFCKRYELDQSRTHLLLSELESAQNQASLALTKKELKNISIKKIQQRLIKFKQNQKLMILAMSIKFIGTNQIQGSSNKTLLKFLKLNKESKKILEKQILKQCLVYETNSQRLNKKRVAIWTKLLGLDSDKKDYYAFRDKVNNTNTIDRMFEDDGEYYQTQTLKSSVSELIAMDVQRSFHNLRDIVKPEILNNILKTYAFFNPEIEYCQGMNFVAGFLFLVFRDEKTSFQALMRVAEIFDMSNLYKKELPKLKLFFYQLDRLIAIQLPQLHQHFKDEQINSGIFASAWFITQFTNSLQAQDRKFNKNLTDEKQIEEQLISDNLLQLWDYFISSGWKSILKMSLYILKINEEKLLQLGFEDILNQISEQPKLILSGNCQSLDRIEDELYGLCNLEDKNKNNLFEDEIITMYQRFQRGLEKDEDNNYMHIDYLMDKFKLEFDQQLQQAEVKKQSFKN